MRKTKTVIIPDSPEFRRDQKKQFYLTEMSAARAEKWAARAFLALAHSGTEVPPDIVNSGFAGIAILGLRSLTGLQFEEAEPLLDEMMGCVQYVPDPKNPLIMRSPMDEADDIEEVATRVFLRTEVFQLHVDFSIADALAESRSAPASISPTNSSTTQMLPEQSAA